MITPKDLNPHNYPTNSEIDTNLALLADKLNQIETRWGRPFTITSGLRDVVQQQALIAAGKTKATNSKHLTGQAADIYDPSDILKDWIMDNLEFIEDIGFWFERFGYTPNWVHWQIVPPGSGERFFIP
jgi:hypothetical protein